ncbi:MAG: ABC transporter permease [Rhodobacteraceae bacterium]|nr:ABC transporter permease [Paracoccaceae bacterium]
MRTNSSFSNTFMGFVEFSTLVYHSIVRDVRKGKGNAMQALILEVLQSAIIVIFFYVMIEFLGMRGVAVRGSFILYVLSGVFLYLTHNKAISAVGGGSATNPMLKHAPVSTLMIIVSGALSSLYIQLLAIFVVTFVANVLIDPFTVYNMKLVFFCLFLAWSSGVAIGLVFLSLKPFFPETIKIISTIYRRANMIFSGKMFLANTIPSTMLPFFSWNPLFHTIDQSRGAAFVNYTPHVTNLWYPAAVTAIFVLIGMMLEHWSRKYVSESWSSRR